MSAAVRASIERGDSLGYLSHGTMSGGIDTSGGVGVPLRSALTARTDEAVADDPHRPDLQLGVVESEPDGQNADAMEHERQSRLRRWQAQPIR
jgi:hypothetical protein